ncbi:response regulator transcription factor [Spirosoma taeanense]|nr:response regulator [Spirosoma taeanense]
MLSYRLQKEGYTVLTASDGKQALECLRTNIPDLVITDLMMPYHSGLEVLEYVKKSLNTRIPVLVLSASGQEQTVLKAFSLGADDFALKPFSPNELVSRVRRHLGNS